MIYQEFMDADYRIFGLYQVIDGVCQCGRKDCPAAGKHPVSSAWQHTPDWSDDQVEVMEISGQLGTGYGVLCQGLLVVDVDERNGGAASYARLVNDIPEIAGAGLIVKTGSGGESKHLYFKIPTDLSLLQHHNLYDGIDFKSSGFVVGPGSLHKSGDKYKTLVGSPAEITCAPPRLLALLERPKMKKALLNGSFVDVSAGDLVTIVSHIRNDDTDYEAWVSIGMAIHHASGGEAYKLWEDWSKQSAKYDPGQMGMKWHSFGKSTNPVTLGTLIHMAEKNGYVKAITFQSTEIFIEPDDRPGELPFSTRDIDLLRPPGFVGQVVKWMNSCSYEEPLEHLNVITALTAVGNIIGMHTTDDMSGVSTNLISLCVAESAAGKEGVQTCFAKIMRAAGMGGAIAGDVKSKQEIVRNLIENQCVFYLVDELGEMLRTIENSKLKGGAPYLEGITGMLMAAFTKAGSSMFVSGDVRREMVDRVLRDIKQLNARLEAGTDKNTRSLENRIERMTEMLTEIQTNGLKNPFLSLIGYSVSASMDCIMTEEMAKNGFLSRALLIVEPRDNPKPILNAVGPTELPVGIDLTIKGLASGGRFEATAGRLEHIGERTKIPSTTEAHKLMQDLRIWQHEYAEWHREHTGFTPLARRSWEMIGKISLILATPGRLRTVEHVIWAAAFVKGDLDHKIRHINSSNGQRSVDSSEVREGMSDRILNLCSRTEGECISIILRKCKRKGVDPKNIESLVEEMVESGQLLCEEKTHGKGRTTKRYFSVLH